MFPLPTPFLITSLKYLLHFLSIFTPNLLHFKNLLRYFTVFYDTFPLKKNVCNPWFQANFSIFPSTLFCCENFFSNYFITIITFCRICRKFKYIKNTPVLLFMYIPHNYPLIVMTSNIKFDAITFVHHHTITNQPKIL